MPDYTLEIGDWTFVWSGSHYVTATHPRMSRGVLVEAGPWDKRNQISDANITTVTQASLSFIENCAEIILYNFGSPKLSLVAS